MADFPGWEQLVLKGIGAPATPENLRFLQAWHAAEKSVATYNPLNTTMEWPGATDLPNNPDHVKNYPSATAGLDATVATLKLPYYAQIVKLLRSGTATADQLAAAVAASPWGTGKGVERALKTGRFPLSTAGESSYSAAGGIVVTPESVQAAGAFFDAVAQEVSPLANAARNAATSAADAAGHPIARSAIETAAGRWVSALQRVQQLLNADGEKLRSIASAYVAADDAAVKT